MQWLSDSMPESDQLNGTLGLLKHAAYLRVAFVKLDGFACIVDRIAVPF